MAVGKVSKMGCAYKNNTYARYLYVLIYPNTKDDIEEKKKREP